MRTVTVAAIQMACVESELENLNRAEALVREAAEKGANIILLPELFESPYFCKKEKLSYYQKAKPVHENQAVQRFKSVAAELGIVLPISFYERENNALYNSVAVIDATGVVLGVYRKSHIPDGSGYEEKFYFNPGDTGFKVFSTKWCKIGVGICWDQWFPEAARIMGLLGAELLLYPTAIGSEPEAGEVDSMEHWLRCMQGHAAANIIPVIAANRFGVESEDDVSILFYGCTFMTDAKGQCIKQLSRHGEAILLNTYDLEAIDLQRLDWGVYRDRRPDLYGRLMTSDGNLIK